MQVLDKVKSIADAKPPKFLYCDVTDLDALKTCAEKAIAEYGTVDVLINNAGAAGPSSRVPSSGVTPESFDLDFDRRISTTPDNCDETATKGLLK